MASLGSFASLVDLPEALRPWAAAGLDALFAPGGIPDAAQPEAASAHPPVSGQSAPPQDAPGADAPAWPEPWAALASRCRTRPRMIITYASLWQDLTGNADSRRRKLFQNVLAYLAWPPGSTLFWPVVMDRDPQEAGFFAADIFAQGVRHFQVAHVAAFGAQVRDRCVTLFPQDDAKPEVTVHALPAPEDLLALLPHELHKALAALKALPRA